MNRPAAIYARVSSDRQKENQTIASQTAALKEYAESHGYLVPAEWVFEDDGYSGASLIRPGLEAMRDLAAQGQIEAGVCTRSSEPKVCLPSVAGRGIRSLRRLFSISESAIGRNSGRPTTRPVPGHDCGV